MDVVPASKSTLFLGPLTLVPFRVFVFEGTFLLVDSAIVISKCEHVLEDISMSKLSTRRADESSRSGPGDSTTDTPGPAEAGWERRSLIQLRVLGLKYAVPPYEREPAQAGGGRHVVARCVITEHPKLDLTVWEDGLVALAGLGRG